LTMADVDVGVLARGDKSGLIGEEGPSGPTGERSCFFAKCRNEEESIPEKAGNKERGEGEGCPGPAPVGEGRKGWDRPKAFSRPKD